MNQSEFFILLFAIAVVVALLLVLLFRRQTQDVAPLLNQLQQTSERTERELRQQIQTSEQGTRQELGGNFSQFQQALTTQMTSVATLQNNQIEAFAQQLAKLSERTRCNWKACARR